MQVKRGKNEEEYRLMTSTTFIQKHYFKSSHLPSSSWLRVLCAVYNIASDHLKLFFLKADSKMFTKWLYKVSRKMFETKFSELHYERRPAKQLPSYERSASFSRGTPQTK